MQSIANARAALLGATVALVLLIGMAAAFAQAHDPTTVRGQIPGGNDQPPVPTPVSTTIDQNGATARISVPGSSGSKGGGQEYKRDKSRPVSCFYVPEGAVVAPQLGAVTRITYSEVRQYYKPGARFLFSCRYLDGDGIDGYTGTYVLGEEPPEPVGTREQDAVAALDLWVHGDFPSPVVTSKPGLENQRVGIATYFAVPTIAGPVKNGPPALELKATPQKRVTFKVPVVDHGAETFECGVDTSTGVPDSRCSHTFSYRTGQSVLAEVTVYFTVTYTSDVTGEVDVPVGQPIPRTSLIPMVVKDLQARAN